MDKLRSIILTFGAWFFGLTFIFGAIGRLVEGSLIAALLLLIGGILLLPPVKRLILIKYSSLTKTKITIVGLALILISSFFVKADEKINPNETENIVQEQTQNTDSNITAQGSKESELTPNYSELTPSYKVVKDTVKERIKRTVEVELLSRADEQQLRALAQQIYNLKEANGERTFIGYRIEGEDKGQAFWATTNYDPDLKVTIFGLSEADYEKIKKAPLPQGEIVGSWMVNLTDDYRITVYRKNDKTYMENLFSDGRSSNEEYTQFKLQNGLGLQDEIGRELGEYFVVTTKGDLEIWSKNGKFYTARKQ